MDNLPELGNGNFIVVEVEFTPAVWTTWCGATSAEFSMNNEIIATKVRDCTDLTKAIKTVKKYGAQDVTISIDANWTPALSQKTYMWAKEQETHNVRLRWPNAAVGQISEVSGSSLLEGLTLGGILNVEGDVITEQVNLQISGSLGEEFAT